jgi:replicative DNA helicase
MKSTDISLYKLPPQNIEAEQCILGSILLENDAINSVLEIISADDFYSDAHRKIFKIIQELYDKNEPLDLITLHNALKDKKWVDAVGGTSYLASLVDNVPSSANVVN